MKCHKQLVRLSWMFFFFFFFCWCVLFSSLPPHKTISLRPAVGFGDCASADNQERVRFPATRVVGQVTALVSMLCWLLGIVPSHLTWLPCWPVLRKYKSSGASGIASCPWYVSRTSEDTKSRMTKKELSFTFDLVFSILHPDTISVGDKAAVYYISWTSDGHYLRAQSQGHHTVDSLEERCGKRKWWTVFFERTLELFQSNVGAISERWHGAHVGFPEH